MIGTIPLIYRSHGEGMQVVISAKSRAFSSIAEAGTAELAGLASMGNKAARATTERMQRGGPKLAYVLLFAYARLPLEYPNVSFRTAVRGFRGESE